MRGGVQTTAIDTSMNGEGALPIDISEQMMPMLSLQLYAATPQCGRLHVYRNANFVVRVRRGADFIAQILFHQLIFSDCREVMNQFVGHRSQSSAWRHSNH